MRHVANVESARCDVRCDECFDLALAELIHDSKANALLVAAVKSVNGVGQLNEIAHEIVHVRTPFAEDDKDIFAIALFDEARQGTLRSAILNPQPALIDRIGSPHSRRRSNFDRLARVIARQLQHLGREGCREEQRLALLRNEGQDALDVVEEADFEHHVGLVEHAELGPREAQELLLVEVDHAPWCTDDDLRASAQGVDLLVHALAADDEGDIETATLSELREHACDLLCQFPRGAEHERQDRGPVIIELRDDGRAEGQRLPRSRLGFGDDVAAFEDGTDRQRLDRCRAFDTHPIGNGLENFGIELPIPKGLDLRRRCRGMKIFRRRAIGSGFSTARPLGRTPGTSSIGSDCLGPRRSLNTGTVRLSR